MNYIFPKRQLSAIIRPYLLGLLTVLVFGTATAFAFEDSATTSSDAPYQSAFEGYRTISKDTLTDWKSINQPSGASGHAGHQMQGMQHDMQPSEINSAKSTMDHSGMDHSKMAHNDTPVDSAPNNTMDHNMANMSHQHMNHEMSGEKSTSSPSTKSGPTMDHSKMTSMEHQHGTSDGSMGKMDHSQMENMAQPSNTAETNDPEAVPHTHSSESDMQVHDTTKPMPNTNKMEETSATSAEPTITGFSIIPNMHPAVVHFPIALTLIALLFSLAARLLGKHSAAPLLAAAGHFTLWLAALSAVVAAILGWLAFNSGMNHDDAGHAAMLLHREWAIPTALGLVLLASWDAWRSRVSQVMPVIALLCLLALSGAIATTAWLGAEIVYRHGIGVLSLPVNEGAGGHNHQHNGSHVTEHSHETAEPDEHGTHQHDDTQGESHEH